ncbi:MAG: KH domain-containing protein [Verrucomicrobiota bacterium]
MKHFLDFVLAKLATEPGEVEVRETEQGDTTVYHIYLNPDDIGRVIGKHGRTIGAIRGLLNVAAARDQRKVSVEIQEPGAP